MSEELLNLLIVGLKCDNESCDYSDDTVKFSDYDKYLDAPCPKCGESLLTPEDLAATKGMMEVANMINGMKEALYPDGVPEDAERVDVELKMKGDGSIEFGDIK